MRRLVWAFAGHTYHIVGNHMSRPICKLKGGKLIMSWSQYKQGSISFYGKAGNIQTAGQTLDILLNIVTGSYQDERGLLQKWLKKWWLMRNASNKRSQSCTIYQSKREGKDHKSINQIPNLTQDANGKVTHSELDITKREPIGQPFPSRCPQGINKQTRKKDNIQKTEITWIIHNRSNAIERSVKYFTGGLKPVSQRQPHP